MPFFEVAESRRVLDVRLIAPRRRRPFPFDAAVGHKTHLHLAYRVARSIRIG
jgi:hypothetical protein